MKKRIIGIDIARALAIIGMIVVNFKLVLGSQGSPNLQRWVGVLDGKAAATFVVLAGLGIGLMSKKAIEEGTLSKIRFLQKKLIKRSIFLWLFGLLFYTIWTPDILHFYAIYILISIALISASTLLIGSLIVVLILSYPFLLMAVSYEQGWDFTQLEYLDFWTGQGFFRNLLVNGFHPVFPWVAFMLFGMWLGRQNLTQKSFLIKTLISASFIFVGTQLLSHFTINLLNNHTTLSLKDIQALCGTAPMPPLPYYMISGISIAVIIICLCILATHWTKETTILRLLVHTGQLALSFYVLHVLVLFFILAIIPKQWGTYSLIFSLVAAFICVLCCFLFATVWRKRFQLGPLEWVLRKLTD
ncbi:DUF418 domain-containing protein [Aureispira anguillae]|uniref:DUF418 domain-containing protein n=1 Tax=Aureispira anguillae TaxID=2864201 RepID=A0A915YG49_9BACT|nr:DUF418 domain-containing protein [Aureispira anguillae]BDS12523.1 DUF418 domain-containing protein [Aureispira anguillae]